MYICGEEFIPVKMNLIKLNAEHNYGKILYHHNIGHNVLSGYSSTLYIGIAMVFRIYSPHTLGNSVLTFTFKSFYKFYGT